MTATDLGTDAAQPRRPVLSANLTLRIASAAVLLALVVAALWTGFVEVTAVVVAAALVAAWEYQRLMRLTGTAPPGWLLYPLTAWLALSFSIPAVPRDALTPAEAGVVLGLLAGVVTRTSFARWSAALGGALYAGFSLSYYVGLYRWRAVDTSHFGLRLVALALICVVANDSIAYFTGTAIGRHPFFPSISPHKSLEGAVGGAIAATVLGAAVGPALVGIHWPAGAGLGLLAAVAAQGGDLAESSLKRQAGVKDSSNLIPGHGGLLDRVDSLVLVGPVLYCYLKLIAL